MKKWTEFSCLFLLRYDFDEKHRRDSRFRVFVSFTDFVFFILHIIEWVLKMKKWLFSPAPKVKSKRLLHHRWLITYFPFWSFLNEFQMPFKLTVVIYVSLLIYYRTVCFVYMSMTFVMIRTQCQIVTSNSENVKPSPAVVCIRFT